MNEFVQFILERLGSGLVLILLAVPLLAGCLVAAYLICKRKHRLFPWKKVILWSLAAVYLLLLLYATLLRGWTGIRAVNLHLFRAWREAWNNYSVKNWLNVLLNVAMFVPLGILLPLLCPKLEKWYAVIGTGFCLSVVIELIQLWRCIGVCDVDDLFANTLGTVTGFALTALTGSIFTMGKFTWKRCLPWVFVLAITLGSISGIFVTYHLQEYGNIPEAAAFRANTSNTKWTLSCTLPTVESNAPIYRAQSITKEECDAFGAAFAEAFNIAFDDIKYYDKETYFMDHGGNDGSHFLIVSYLDGSYDYSRGMRDEDAWADADRQTLMTALVEYPLIIPEEAAFSADGDGWHSFTADRLVIGDNMYDGVIRCRCAADGEIYRIENHLVCYTIYGQTEIISPEEAYNALCAGNFSGGDYFERRRPKEVHVTGAALEYMIDTKGFYRPVYIFDLVSTDSSYQTSVMVLAD